MIKVLIVDDEELERRALKIILTRLYGAGLELYEAETVTEAVTTATASEPDVVLLDIKVPGSDGLRGAKILKSRFPGVKVAIVTAHTEYEYAHLAMRFSVDEYLLKPARPQTIATAIDRMLSQNTEAGLDTTGTMRELEAALMSGNYQQSRYLFQRSAALLDERLDSCKTWASAVLTLLENTRRVYNIEGVEFMSSAMEDLNAEREVGPVIEGVRSCMEQIFEDIINSKLAKLGSKLDYAVEYIEKNLHREITLGEVARFMNTSPHYFSRIFKRNYSQSFIDFVTDRRMVQAVIWFRNTDKTITEAALELGYSEANYFSKVFRRRIGVPPSEFKRLPPHELHAVLRASLNAYHRSFTL